MRKLSVTGEAYDIPTMEDLPIEEYRRYLETDLLFIDSHECCGRASVGFLWRPRRRRLKL